MGSSSVIATRSISAGTMRDHLPVPRYLLDKLRQGLCVFDGKQRLVVFNRRYAELYGLAPDDLRFGMTLREIVALRDAAGTGPEMGPSEYARWRTEVMVDTRVSETIVGLRNGRTIEIYHEPTADGGWVSTHDDITERRRAEMQIAHMASHDPLTDLPNRTRFRQLLDERLAQMNDTGGSCAVLCLDLDHFKDVNDTYGHCAGDGLLREIAARWNAVLGNDGTLARVGGDEFVVLLNDATNGQHTALMTDSLIGASVATLALPQGRIQVGVSIGVALAPTHGDNSETLLRRADLALLRAKSDGRNSACVFSPDLENRVQVRRRLEAELRHAIDHGDLFLHYQPQIRGTTRELLGFEALVRWRHPQNGLVSPSDFIAVAEESGLIHDLGEAVLRMACKEAATWSHPYKVAVNLSAKQFQQADLSDRLFRILSETALPPARLELEVTESVIVKDMARALTILRRLRGLGVSIAMDDFGTGYSSLATLLAFPFDKLKLDRSFVSRIDDNPQAAVIVRAVLGLGRNLGISIVAEGVETPSQLQFLEAEGCDELQGFLFGQPRPISHYDGFVRAEPPSPDFTAMLAIDSVWPLFSKPQDCAKRLAKRPFACHDDH